MAPDGYGPGARRFSRGRRLFIFRGSHLSLIFNYSSLVT